MMKLIIKQEVFDEALARHKKILAGLKFVDIITKEGQERAAGRFMALERTGRELALAYSGLKCEKNSCGVTTNLQFHHLIMRQIKDFTDFYRYETQRKYWANILVLCSKHHQDIHKINQFSGHRPRGSEVIKPNLINHVRKKFFKEI